MTSSTTRTPLKRWQFAKGRIQRRLAAASCLQIESHVVRAGIACSFQRHSRYLSKLKLGVAYASMANDARIGAEASAAQAAIVIGQSIVEVQSAVERAKLATWQQGDAELATKDSLRERRKLRWAAPVTEALDSFWQLLESSGFTATCADDDSTSFEAVTKAGYEQIYLRAYKLLIDTWDPDEAASTIDEDWIADVRGRSGLPRPALADSLFELADTWTEGISVAEYASFLWRLYDGTARAGHLRELEGVQFDPIMEVACDGSAPPSRTGGDHSGKAARPRSGHGGGDRGDRGDRAGSSAGGSAGGIDGSDPSPDGGGGGSGGGGGGHPRGITSKGGDTRKGGDGSTGEGGEVEAGPGTIKQHKVGQRQDRPQGKLVLMGKLEEGEVEEGRGLLLEADGDGDTAAPKQKRQAKLLQKAKGRKRRRQANATKIQVRERRERGCERGARECEKQQHTHTYIDATLPPNVHVYTRSNPNPNPNHSLPTCTCTHALTLTNLHVATPSQRARVHTL